MSPEEKEKWDFQDREMNHEKQSMEGGSILILIAALLYRFK